MPFKEVNPSEILKNTVKGDLELQDICRKESENYEKVKTINRLIEELRKDGVQLTAKCFELEIIEKVQFQ